MKLWTHSEFDYTKWHKWFAWRPVWTLDNDCVWLETVERKRTNWFEWEYREIGNE